MQFIFQLQFWFLLGAGVRGGFDVFPDIFYFLFVFQFEGLLYQLAFQTFLGLVWYFNWSPDLWKFYSLDTVDDGFVSAGLEVIW